MRNDDIETAISSLQIFLELLRQPDRRRKVLGLDEPRHFLAVVGLHDDRRNVLDTLLGDAGALLVLVEGVLFDAVVGNARGLECGSQIRQ